MTARLLDGKAIAADLRSAVRDQAEQFRETADRPPLLAAVLVGDQEASLTYAKAKGKAARECGLDYRLVQVPAADGTAAVVAAVRQLAADPLVDAMLLELPLPPGCDTAQAVAALDPARDADGITPPSLGRLLLGQPGPRPATAQAVLELLAAAAVPLAGARAVVIGRSAHVGLPTALLLVHAHATVSVAHTRTRDLAALTRQADILVVAAGRPALIGPAHVRPGAVVIDVGTTVLTDAAGSRVVGDVAPEVHSVAGVLSPVPGGVGPVTTAVLLRTVVELAHARWRQSPLLSR